MNNNDITTLSDTLDMTSNVAIPSWVLDEKPPEIPSPSGKLDVPEWITESTAPLPPASSDLVCILSSFSEAPSPPSLPQVATSPSEIESHPMVRKESLAASFNAAPLPPTSFVETSPITHTDMEPSSSSSDEEATHINDHSSQPISQPSTAFETALFIQPTGDDQSSQPISCDPTMNQIDVQSSHLQSQETQQQQATIEIESSSSSDDDHPISQSQIEIKSATSSSDDDDEDELSYSTFLESTPPPSSSIPLPVLPIETGTTIVVDQPAVESFESSAHILHPTPTPILIDTEPTRDNDQPLCETPTPILIDSASTDDTHFSSSSHSPAFILSTLSYPPSASSSIDDRSFLSFSSDPRVTGDTLSLEPTQKLVPSYPISRESLYVPAPHPGDTAPLPRTLYYHQPPSPHVTSISRDDMLRHFRIVNGVISPPAPVVGYLSDNPSDWFLPQGVQCGFSCCLPTSFEPMLIQFNANGIDGQKGADGNCGAVGHYGGGRGGNGWPGECGENGQDARSLELNLACISNEVVVSGFLGSTTRDVLFTPLQTQHWPLGFPGATLQLSAVGGFGGNGGHGGSGGGGGAGYPGSDATRYSSGTNGQQGGDGGNGGYGGDGGNGGAGGNIQMNLQAVDSDLLMTLHQQIPLCHGGQCGIGGAGGRGGSGGPGGPGGMGYQWTEVVYSGDQTYTSHHSMPGGGPGPQGRPGFGGAAGRNGSNGRDGQFLIALHNPDGSTEVYPGPYDLTSTVYNIADTLRYEIIEPGSQVHVSMSLRNCGDMPTPLYQKIWAHISSSRWVNCSDRVSLPLGLRQGQQISLDRPIVLDIADSPYPTTGKPLHVPICIEHRAVVERVNQDFERVRGQYSDIVIQHAVEASIGIGADAVSFGEEAPILYQINNKSAKAIGLAALPHPRFLSVKYSIHHGSPAHVSDLRAVCLKDIAGTMYFSRQGMTTFVPSLDPKSGVFAGCVLQFLDPAIPPYSRVCIDMTLYLGIIRDLMIPRSIQIRPFEVQLAESYRYDPVSFCLLVVNNRSQLDEVRAWQTLLEKTLHSPCSIWNISLYSDFKPDHMRKDGRSLLQDMCCGLIVYLNNPLSNEKNEGLFPASHLRERELFLLARDYGVHTLVVGCRDGVDLPSLMFPALPEPKVSVYFKDTETFFKSYEGQMFTGAGSAQPQPAYGEYDLCACVKRGSRSAKELWLTVNHGTKTLCLFDSPKSTYPLKAFYLGDATLLAPPADAIPEDPREQRDLGFSLILGSSRTEALFWSRMRDDPSRRPLFGAASMAARYHQTPRFTFDLHVLLELLRQCCWQTRSAQGPAPSSSSSSSSSSSAAAAQQDPAASRPALQGMMYKRGEVMTGYRDRMFSLYATPPRLTYEASTAKIIPLTRYQLQTEGTLFGMESATDAHLKFQIVTPGRTYFLKCHSIEEKHRWIHHLKLCSQPVDRHQVFREPCFDLKREALQLRRALARSTSTPSEPASNPNAPSIAYLFGIPHIASHAIRHNAVITIPVSRRHFVRKASEGKLRGMAHELAEKLAQSFPNQTNVVVYRFNPLANDKSNMHGFSHNYGTLEIHRGLDRLTPHVTYLHCADEQALHSSQFITSAPAVFSLFKALDFDQKLLAFDELAMLHPKLPDPDITAGVSLLSSDLPMMLQFRMIVRAILSDIADEQAAFRSHKWIGELSSAKARERLHTLQSLLTFEFQAPLIRLQDSSFPLQESAFGLTIIEICSHALYISSHSVSIADMLLPQRRSSLLTKTTNKLLHDILFTHLKLTNAADPAAPSPSTATVPPQQQQQQQPPNFPAFTPPGHTICKFIFEGFHNVKKSTSILVPLEPHPDLPALSALISHKTGLPPERFRLTTPATFLPLSLEEGVPAEICVVPTHADIHASQDLRTVSPLLASKARASRPDSVPSHAKPRRSPQLKAILGFAPLISASWSAHCLAASLHGFTTTSRSSGRVRLAASEKFLQAFQVCSDIVSLETDSSTAQPPIVLSGAEFDRHLISPSPSNIIERNYQFSNTEQRHEVFENFKHQFFDTSNSAPLLQDWESEINLPESDFPI